MPKHDDWWQITQTEARGETYAFFARLLREEASAELLCLLRKVPEEAKGAETVGEGQVLLDRYLAEIGLRDDKQVLSELATDFAGLFLNAGSRPVHPYESVYTSPERLMMQEARDRVRQIYAVAGLARSGSLPEPEDHIALEMEFMRHLCARTAEAIEERNAERVRAHLHLQQEFLKDHVLRWVPQFCEDLARNAATGFYRALACLLRDFLESERSLMDEQRPM